MLKKIAICLALVGAPQFAAAQSVQDQIVSQLREQGFGEITLQRTWLGRIRVMAIRDDLQRELVFNPTTGEILRDYWRTLDKEDSGGFKLFNPGGNSGSSGSSGSGDDDGNDDNSGNGDDGNDDDGNGDDGGDDDSGDDDSGDDGNDDDHEDEPDEPDDDSEEDHADDPDEPDDP